MTEYRWPTLKPVIRQFVVRDDQGRYGIAYQDNYYHEGTLFAHPIDVATSISSNSVPGAEMLPSDALLMTDTAFSRRDDGTYKGTWYDYRGLGLIPPKDIRTLTIVDDLGYVMPDEMADHFLAGSDQLGHWDSYWAAIAGKKGGSSTSQAKAAASRSNGRKGGRPRKIES